MGAGGGVSLDEGGEGEGEGRRGWVAVEEESWRRVAW